ncbi:N-acyl-phosphatidylethanolamine-hydrolyzing phospholipase D [Holothuria leucospilota]|uniref:N-acetylphosphatidylethanolamine-hydrolyzing phospholipase D n=1 Tax=Holothuria leucospilota TaxID=206669 RepID=A0A9Q1CNP7_HOLLE|nr:N-acyl-phosphatidylethanolamine-hydrolyzing phospholipase D [Holothuria leucospilota]
MEETSDMEALDKPIFKDGRYNNPWDTWRWPPLKKMFRWFLLDKNLSSVPSQSILNSSLPIVPVDNNEELETPPSSGVRLLWIGHASTLVQFDGVTLLTDPVFGSRCGLYSSFGPKRYRHSPMSVELLPTVNAVIISHNHYDHLDIWTVSKLNQRFGKNLKWFVPMGNKIWLENNGCENVEELTWWQETKLSVEGKEIMVACTPCQHWSNRGLLDRCKTLWSSWVVKGPNHSFFFGGDTGYCSVFKQIGKKYGPFTVAAIPIGAYYPRDCLTCQHVNPEEAVEIHKDIKSMSSVGIHWGTFALTYEHYLEPPIKLKKALKDQNLEEDAFVTLKHGESKIFQEKPQNSQTISK